MALRSRLYGRGVFTASQLPVPVVVVGNITTGGTGKTPLTIALSLALEQRGWRPGIISRGYGSEHSHARAVRPPHNALSTGDEPLLMARSTGLPVWVGHDRAETGAALLQDNPGVNVIICDDGLQHLALRRDFEIAVIDGRRTLGNGWLLPGGPLREPAHRLDSVDAIVINGDSQMAKSHYRMELEPQCWVNLAHPDEQWPPQHFQGQTCHAVAGISNPDRFFATLKTLGVEVVEHAYPDHHPFVRGDLCFTPDLPILMTEKDGIKCTSFAPENAYELRVMARVDTALVERLDNFLRERVHGQQVA
jgi:tetraacyldisaccharide 4'-kinase